MFAASNRTTIRPLEAIAALVSTGAAGRVRARRVWDAADAELVPSSFVAVAVHEYEVSGDRFATTMTGESLVAVRVTPESVGEQVAE